MSFRVAGVALCGIPCVSEGICVCVCKTVVAEKSPCLWGNWKNYLYTPHLTHNTPHFTLPNLHSTVYTLRSTLHSTLPTLHCTHITLYTFTLHPLHATLEAGCKCFACQNSLLFNVVWLPGARVPVSSWSWLQVLGVPELIVVQCGVAARCLRASFCLLAIYLTYLYP